MNLTNLKKVGLIYTVRGNYTNVYDSLYSPD